MLILNNVSDETGGGEDRANVEVDLNPEYQTASELFDLMTKNTGFHPNVDDTLSTQDLVLLYKNIDIGTKLMNDATVMKVKKPNQYVETIVYNDDPESESELSEIYSSEDLHNVFSINQERLDFLNDNSLEHLLSHKFGGMEINSSKLSTEYNKNFLFKDSCIKNQLINLNPMASSSEFNNIFSTSLIDYICCKRLEDNYNFYMDNIIRYVQHTIEQLKRISNGDYLTDRAKEKWREVNSNDKETDTKVLATSTSIPLHVECKSNRNVTWDDIVHSEVDVRSLSKILEKKIIVEIPKLICGSYRLYSKRFADNLIISCQKQRQKIEKEGQESRVDVVLQLQRSQTGQVMSNISSIMILRTSPALQDLRQKKILSLQYKERTDNKGLDIEEDYTKEPKVTIIELGTDADYLVSEFETENEQSNIEQIEENEDQSEKNSLVGTNDYPYSECEQSADACSNFQSSDTSFALKDTLAKPLFPIQNEATFNMISPDELRISMRRLSMQKSVLDESGEDLLSCNTSKKRSPIRVRIKSPYENKSFVLEEKKRKKLLEIRERREKKKIALSENCKISKHKYGKVAIMPQASSSVTKLSITNKSFYNSIYGQTVNTENKMPKLGKPIRKSPKINSTEVSLTEELHEEYVEHSTSEKNTEKYTNRSYYLDDAETEVMYTEINENKDERHLLSESNSAISNELNENLNLSTEFNQPSVSNISNMPILFANDTPPSLAQVCCREESSIELPNAVDLVHATADDNAQLLSKKCSSSDECRKSIDQLYDLIKKFTKPPTVPADIKKSKSKMATNLETYDEVGCYSTIQGSDSGTSVKHHDNVTSSNHTGFSSDKNNTITICTSNKNTTGATAPKVIISSKLQQSPKVEVDKVKKDRRRVTVNPSTKGVQDNPLKAISQLVHEFDNVQKTKQKAVLEIRPPKKPEVVPNDLKNNIRQGSQRRRSRLEQHLKDNELERRVTPTYNNPKEKRARPLPPLELSRIPHQATVEDKNFDKIAKKKIADIIDEVKEARGEAVRGPSKLNSRLNSLAQPKKSYVQAHHEEYQNRYGRNHFADRLHRLATAPVSPPDRNVVSPTSRNKARRSGGDPPTMKQHASLASHLDKGAKAKSPHRSASSSPSFQHVVPDAPEAIKKMVAVESYVNSHYGAVTSPSPPSVMAHVCRVPLIPLDLELASSGSSPLTEEANELGNKLHQMVDSVLMSALPAPLSALTECEESSLKDDAVTTHVHICAPGTHSDYKINNLEDKDLKTAVEAVEVKNTTDEDIPPCPNPSIYDLQPLNSTTELEKLEHALYTQISGAFQKRLRIKNLTLTPKHSMQQVFLVQSGDAGSLLLKSTVSNMKMNKCSAENLHELKVTPVLSNYHLDWTFTQIPMQIATVGYAFPEYQTPKSMTSSKSKLVEVSNVASTANTIQRASTSDKISQCFKRYEKVLAEVGAQVDVKEFSPELVTVSVGSLNNHLTISEVSENIEITNEIPNDDSETVSKLGCVDNGNDTTKAVIDADKDENGVKIEETQVKNTAPVASLKSVDYTSSLDMLVGLLNEIQKITCQNQMATDDNTQNCAGLKSILNDAVALETIENKTCHDIISISSLDHLRQLESSSSIYSFNLSSDSDGNANDLEPVSKDVNNVAYGITDEKLSDNINTTDNKILDVPKPTTVDKEVSANIPENSVKEYMNTLTDIPSSLVPLVANSANITNSSVGVFSEPSIQSLISIGDYQTIYSNALFRTASIKKIIQLPSIEQSVIGSRDKADLTENNLHKDFSSRHLKIHIKNVKKECLVSPNELKTYCGKNTDLDPMLKIKRDILVTVYSILVLTVFAALSFPELIMLQ